MSAWQFDLPAWRVAPPATRGAWTRARTSARLLCLVVVLAGEGFALAHSTAWAVPLLCGLLIVAAVDIPLLPFLAVTLLARVLTDNLASAGSRYSASVNLSGAIAGLLILVAVGLLARFRRGSIAISLGALWLALFTLLAARTHGASGETLREGVREGSILALAAIACNSRGVLNVRAVTRLAQLVGLVPALLALYQLATHTGANVEGQIRSEGTFSHPNGAAMFFAIVAGISLWRYMELGRRRADGLLAALFALATISTFSLTGLAGLLAILMALGALRAGSLRVKLGAFAAAAVVIAGFLATPLGSARLASESATRLSSAQTRGTANSSFAWRLYKWGTLIPQWERSPVIGGGLGTTVTAEGNSEDVTAGKVPHNEYLRYLVETGVLGLGILLVALVALFRALARRRAAGSPDAGLLGIALLAGCLVNGLADNTILYSNTGYLMALVLGAVLSLPARAATDPAQAVGGHA